MVIEYKHMNIDDTIGDRCDICYKVIGKDDKLYHFSGNKRFANNIAALTVDGNMSCFPCSQ